MSVATHPIHLAGGDVKFYGENGYFIYKHALLPRERFDALKAYFEEIVADLPSHARPEGMDTPHFAFPRLFEWLLADEVLDFVERFIGPDIVFWSSHFLCKPPGKGLAVPWHEDSSYWKGSLSEPKVITVWLAIDDSTVENGCMRVIPGTHHGGFSDYEEVDKEKNVFGTQIKSDQFDEGLAVDLQLRQGECHLHHGRAIHGSNANTSVKRRCGYTMRYMTADVKFTSNENFSHAIYLARGQDRAGNTYTEPGTVYEPGKDRWHGGALSK